MREEGQHAVHVPEPSFAPVVIAGGVFTLNLGFILGLPVGILGLIVLFAGIGLWVSEDVRHYAAGSDEHGG